MTCFYPISAYRSSEINPETGKRGLVFKSNHPLRLREGQVMSVPCGRCIGCRIDRSRDWAVRCVHEAQFHKQNCFLTLTYNKENLPCDYSLSKSVHQKFIKRLRENVGTSLRFFGCGEYGSEEGAFPLQPHYHYLIFGWRPSDLQLHSQRDGVRLYKSERLSRIWPFGFSTVGDVTYQTAAYCARYVLEKIGGDLAHEHYERVHPVTGALCRVQPEFALQSRKPGLGFSWLEIYKRDIYPSDFCVVDGKKHPVPKFYIKLYEEEERQRVKRARISRARKHSADNSSARLRTREQVKLAQVSRLKRGL